MSGPDTSKSPGAVPTTAATPNLIGRGESEASVLPLPDDGERRSESNRAELQRLCDEVGQRAAAAGMNADVLADLLEGGSAACRGA